jgi:hypothetical protein
MERGTLSNWPKGAKAEAEGALPSHKTALASSRSLPFFPVHLMHNGEAFQAQLPLLKIAKPILDWAQPLTINARYRLCGEASQQLLPACLKLANRPPSKNTTKICSEYRNVKYRGLFHESFHVVAQLSLTSPISCPVNWSGLVYVVQSHCRVSG